jgi:hypothetical protein
MGMDMDMAVGLGGTALSMTGMAWAVGCAGTMTAPFSVNERQRVARTAENDRDDDHEVTVKITAPGAACSHSVLKGLVWHDQANL